MSLVLSQIKTPESKAADSRFFVPETSRRFDFEALNISRVSIIAVSDSIRARARNPEDQLRDMDVINLAEQLEDYKDRIKKGRGLFRIVFPDKLSKYSSAYDALVRGYGVPTAEEGLHVVEFASTALSSANTLAFPSTEFDFQPLVDVRIKTPSDAPITIFDRDNGGLRELESDGHWYRFPLADVEIHLLTTSEEV